MAFCTVRCAYNGTITSHAIALSDDDVWDKILVIRMNDINDAVIIFPKAEGGFIRLNMRHIVEIESYENPA